MAITTDRGPYHAIVNAAMPRNIVTLITSFAVVTMGPDAMAGSTRMRRKIDGNTMPNEAATKIAQVMPKPTENAMRLISGPMAREVVPSPP